MSHSLAQESYPQLRLKQIEGVGTLIALTFLPTLQDPNRFGKSRDVGGNLGLQPGRNGTERSADAYQQGRRSLSANAVCARSTTHSETLRGRLSQAMGTEASGAWWKKRQEANYRCDGKSVCPASPRQLKNGSMARRRHAFMLSRKNCVRLGIAASSPLIWGNSTSNSVHRRIGYRAPIEALRYHVQ